MTAILSDMEQNEGCGNLIIEVKLLRTFCNFIKALIKASLMSIVLTQGNACHAARESGVELLKAAVKKGKIASD